MILLISLYYKQIVEVIVVGPDPLDSYRQGEIVVLVGYLILFYLGMLPLYNPISWRDEFCWLNPESAFSFEQLTSCMLLYPIHMSLFYSI